MFATNQTIQTYFINVSNKYIENPIMDYSKYYGELDRFLYVFGHMGLEYVEFFVTLILTNIEIFWKDN